MNTRLQELLKEKKRLEAELERKTLEAHFLRDCAARVGAAAAPPEQAGGTESAKEPTRARKRKRP